jgi:hypothetical protein
MNKKQHRTLQEIFEKPEHSDILWQDIEALFLALGAEVTEGRGSRVTNKVSVRSARRFLIESGVDL